MYTNYNKKKQKPLSYNFGPPLTIPLISLLNLSFIVSILPSYASNFLLNTSSIPSTKTAFNSSFGVTTHSLPIPPTPTHPAKPIANLSSPSYTSSTFRHPSSPPTLAPHIMGRPTNTKSAPKAIALKMSSPYLTPPSNHNSIFFSLDFLDLKIFWDKLEVHEGDPVPDIEFGVMFG